MNANTCANNLEELAAQLGRPPNALSAFAQLQPEQTATLSQAIAGACARERSLLDSAQDSPRSVRWLVRPLFRLLRGKTET